jgi:hypothetical protein
MGTQRNVEGRALTTRAWHSALPTSEPTMTPPGQRHGPRSRKAWADAPFRLTMADVAEAWKGRDRCADDHMWPKPTPVPCTVPSSDDGDCCTFEELEAVLTQLASETADGNSPVPTTTTSPPAPRSLHTAPAMPSVLSRRRRVVETHTYDEINPPKIDHPAQRTRRFGRAALYGRHASQHLYGHIG